MTLFVSQAGLALKAWPIRSWWGSHLGWAVFICVFICIKVCVLCRGMPFRQANVVSVIGASEIWLFQCNFSQYPWPMIALVLALATAVFRNFSCKYFGR